MRVLGFGARHVGNIIGVIPKIESQKRITSLRPARCLEPQVDLNAGERRRACVARTNLRQSEFGIHGRARLISEPVK